MLNLQEMKEAVDQLSAEELHELRQYLEKREIEIRTHLPLSADERIRRLDAAARAIRVGFTDAEWDEVEKAMNEEYIEPWNESEWTD
jgi:hypothetical protein